MEWWFGNTREPGRRHSVNLSQSFSVPGLVPTLNTALWPITPLRPMKPKTSKTLSWVWHFLAPPFLFFHVQFHKVWWQTLVILSLWKAEAGRTWIWGQHGLHSHLKISMGHRELKAKLDPIARIFWNQKQTKTKSTKHNFKASAFLWAYPARLLDAFAIGIPRHNYVLPVFFYHTSNFVQPPQLSYMLRLETKAKGRYYEIPKMQDSYATHRLPSAISAS